MHYLTVAQLLWLQWVEQHAKDDDVLPAGALADDGFGLWRGEGATVLSKGINLCMECVGIG